MNQQPLIDNIGFKTILGPIKRNLGWLINWLISSVVAKVIVGIILIVWAASTTIIHHDELAILTRFGKHVRAPLEPGIYFYFPFMNEIRRYPTTLQFLLITDKSVKPDVSIEEVHFDDGVTITTLDGVETKVVLEVVYQIQKSEKTVNAFVESFGRAQSDRGTAKIEKLVADTTRVIARQLLSNAKLTDIESQIEKYSEDIRNASNGNTLNFRTSTSSPGTALSPQSPLPADLGVEIKRLAYRLRPNAEFVAMRNQSAIELERERARITLVEERRKADLAEAAASEAVLAKKTEIAKIRKNVFENSPDGDLDRVVAAFVEKWDGQLPQIISNDGSVPVADFIPLLRTTENAGSKLSSSTDK